MNYNEKGKFCLHYDKCVVHDGNLLDEVCQHDANRMILQANTHVTKSLDKGITV